MKVKRITAANMQQALRQVTQELGSDAVILSSKKVDQGFEVVAATDYQSGDAEAQAEVERQLTLQRELEQTRRQLQPEASERAEAQVPPQQKAREQKVREQFAQPSAPDSGELRRMSGELKELKNWLVSHQGSPWDQERPMTWQQSQLWQRCQDVGLEPAWSDRLVSRLQPADNLDDSWRQALQLMEQDLPVANLPWLEQGGRYALLGPTGAGKTTTIGKMAAQFVIRHGAESVALITLDNYRIAAHDQLKTFAKILGVRWLRAPQDGTLPELLKKVAKAKLVLIDSAGLASQDPHFTEQLSMLKDCGNAVKKLLVLPLTSQGRCLQENYEHFKSAALHGCIFTKLDECFCLGPAMSIAALARLPLTLVTDGPHIPDDLHMPEASKLVRLAEQMARMARTRWPVPEAAYAALR
ncbi:flagellar biosynthesis protein FlhF [Bacterioplanes sanyensis]|uniref:flagellar biosynthesis protein FlhF n=1 Tax=Bacterioplanes sanyensis TaxID=1249553 RepID=UPI0016798CF7|nr:flagellar biosynthesis protein FlhF [Bacterioplanes sanyensis]GGY39736.1 flagellar biosynthesis protein FlhF [Bacterioplanes sanyensis]